MQSRYSREPRKFGIAAGKIEAFLAETCFEVIEHLTAAEINEKYLSGGSSGIGKAPPLFCLVYGAVIGKKGGTPKVKASESG